MRLISEHTVIDAAKRGERRIDVSEGTIVTAAARDRARQLGITIGEKTAAGSLAAASHSGQPAAPALPAGPKQTIAVGSDHGGFAMKEGLKGMIEAMGHKVVDLGTYSEEACDYPDYAYAVARMVTLGDACKGVMIDSVGIASAIVANKLSGIRAACCTDEFMARSAREHNNANVLTLGGKTLGIETAKAIVRVFIETGFGGGRHQKRLDKITDIEKRSKG